MGAQKKIIVTVDSGGSKSLFESERSNVIVGRSKKADLRLALDGMSREHFALLEKDGNLFVKDLGSANGTMVNGSKLEPLQQKKLAAKDKIEVKGLALKIEAKILDFPAPIKTQASEITFDDREQTLAREIVVEAPQPNVDEAKGLLKEAKEEEKIILEQAEKQALELLRGAEAEAKQIVENAQAHMAEREETEFSHWRAEWKARGEQEMTKFREKVRAEEEAKRVAETAAQLEAQITREKQRLEQEWQAKSIEEKEKVSQEFERDQKKIISEAKDKAHQLIEEAQALAYQSLEEAKLAAREVREKVYQENISLKDQALHAYEKQREEALKLYQETLSRAAQDAEKLVREARREIERNEQKAKEQNDLSKMHAEDTLTEAERKARKMIEEATTQAQHILLCAQEEEKRLKEDAEKLLKNSYATALAMATASDAVNLPEEVPELKSIEFRNIEDLHHTGVENLLHLKQTTGDELAEVQKKKIHALEEEEKNLRASMYERIQLEAREDALRIQQEAEKSAEQILAQAYTLSKRLSVETQHKYLADKARIEQEIKVLDEKYQISNGQVAELQTAIREGELKKRYLINELEQLSLQEATSSHKLANVQNELAKVQVEHSAFVRDMMEHEEKLRERLQLQREDKVAFETQFLSSKKEWDRELGELGEAVSQLREEKTAFLQTLKDGEAKLEDILSEVERQNEECQKLSLLITEEENKAKQAQANYEELAGQESQMREKAEAERSCLQELQSNELEIKKRCHELEVSTQKIVQETQAMARQEAEKIIQKAKESNEQAWKEIQSERDSLDDLKKAQEKLVREEAKIYQEKIIEDARIAGKKEFTQLVEEGKEKKAQMLDKVREMQERIEATNHEMEQKEKEMKEYQTQKMIEAQKEAIALTENVQQQILAARQNAEEEARRLLSDTHLRAEQLLAQAQQEKEQAQARIDSELEAYKADQSRDLAQIKIRELELLKQKEDQCSSKWQQIREEAVQEITENLKMHLLLKLQESLKQSMSPEAQEQFKNGFVGVIQEIVQTAIYPPDQEAKTRSKGLLQGKGKVAKKVKIFWLKVGSAIGLPLVLLTIHLLAPHFFPSIYDATFGRIGQGKSVSDSYVGNEIAASRNRPKYNPAPTPGFKTSYVDNFVFTAGYRDLVLNPKFIEEWTKDCNRFVEQELRMSDETIVALVSHENNLHEQLAPLFKKINPDYEKEGLGRMREVESEYYPKIKALFPTEEKFKRFYKFKEDYFFQKAPKTTP